MKFGMRTPSIKKSIKARTTGKAKRAVKKALIPGYGKKGAGWIKNPKKAAYNKEDGLRIQRKQLTIRFIRRRALALWIYLSNYQEDYIMERVVQFLKEAEIYYLATVEGDQPRVRPFGTAHIFEGKLYIQTGKVKDVSKQIHANPKVEICAFKNGEWLRVAGELVEDDRREARQSMLDAYPSLQNMYSADDGNTEVFYFKNATATFSSFTHEPEVVKF